MKFLFTAPRYHTNQAPIVKGLIEKGHEVRYFVVFVGATEDHTYCEPLVLKPSRTTAREKKKLEKTKTPSEVESAIGGHFIPDYQFLKKAFEDYMPDVVICREKTNLTLCVKSLCDQYGIPCILYDQEPLYRLKPAASNTQQRISQKNSFPKRVKIKLERTLNPDIRMLMRMRATTGFPIVRMTPVKYKMLPKEFSENQSDKNAYYIPFVAESHPELADRDYSSGDMIHILCVGKYREYKNVKLLVKAASILNCEKNWHITFVGQVSNYDEAEYYEQTKDMVAKNKLENNISLEKNIPFKEMERIYLTHDVLVLTSKREVASVAIIEAMSYGLAVISTSYNGTASYVDEADCGAIFETENADDLAEKISAICKSDLTLLGCNAYRYANEIISFDQYYTALRNMLKKEFGIFWE